MLDPPPDCVILDLMLPDDGGHVVLRKIRERRLPTRVAVCTGTSDRERLDAVASLQPDAFLMKPTSLAESAWPARTRRPSGWFPGTGNGSWLMNDAARRLREIPDPSTY